MDFLRKELNMFDQKLHHMSNGVFVRTRQKTEVHYRLLQNAYISNSKTLKSVSASASVTVINSQTVTVCICNPENRQITDMVTDLPYLVTDQVTDILTGFLGFGGVLAIIRKLHICNR